MKNGRVAAGDRHASEILRLPREKSSRSAGRPHAECPCCGGDLNLSQPDEDRDELLLGVCCGCHRWILIDGQAESVTLLELPARRARAAGLGD